MIFMLQKFRTPHGISICLPGSETPDWFSYQSSGSLLTIQLLQIHVTESSSALLIVLLLDLRKLMMVLAIILESNVAMILKPGLPVKPNLMIESAI